MNPLSPPLHPYPPSCPTLSCPHRLQSDPVSTTEPFFEPADIGRVFQTDPTQNERGPVGEPPPGYHPAPSSTPSFHSAFSVQVGPPLMCHLDPQCVCKASSCRPASGAYLSCCVEGPVHCYMYFNFYRREGLFYGFLFSSGAHNA